MALPFCIAATIVLTIAATAQETTTESTTPKRTTKAMTIENSTVVYASGDDVVLKGSDGKLSLLEMPPDTTLPVDGKQVAIHELKPDTVISHAETKTMHEEEVTTVTTIEGKVFHVMAPNYVTLRLNDGSMKRYKVPPHANFVIDGQDKTVFDLRKDMDISATAVTTAVQHVHNTQQHVSGTTGPETPAQMGVLLIFDHDEK
ncbi:MAG: hypothetical protein ABI072_10630 [Edaphobacter sp.]